MDGRWEVASSKGLTKCLKKMDSSEISENLIIEKNL